jgi:hypothetical protein
MKVDKPGTTFGPCMECKHAKCQRDRLKVLLKCPLCSQPIGFNTEYLLDMETSAPVHLACVEEQEAAVAAKLKEATE